MTGGCKVLLLHLLTEAHVSCPVFVNPHNSGSSLSVFTFYRNISLLKGADLISICIVLPAALFTGSKMGIMYISL